MGGAGHFFPKQLLMFSLLELNLGETGDPEGGPSAFSETWTP